MLLLSNKSTREEVAGSIPRRICHENVARPALMMDLANSMLSLKGYAAAALVAGVPSSDLLPTKGRCALKAETVCPFQSCQDLHSGLWSHLSVREERSARKYIMEVGLEDIAP